MGYRCKKCRNSDHGSTNCRRATLSAVEVEQQAPTYEICALFDSKDSNRCMEIIPEGTDSAEECDTTKDDVNPNGTITKQVTWEIGPPVLVEDQLVESEDSEDEADLVAVRVMDPLTDIATEDVLVPQIPNKGFRAFIKMNMKNLGQCIDMMDSGSEVNVIRLSFMEN